MNSKIQEIKDLNKQIKQLQDRVESLQAEISFDVKAGEWYMGINSVVLATRVTKDDVWCIEFRNDGIYGISIDDECWYSHDVFNNDFAKVDKSDARMIFNMYISELTRIFENKLNN